MSLNEKINITIMLLLALLVFAGFVCKSINYMVGEILFKIARGGFVAFLVYGFIMVFCEIWSQ